MSTVNLNLPESLYKQVYKLAQQDGISLNQFIAIAVAEKVAGLMTVEYLRERAKRGSLDKFEAVLAKVPDIEADTHDRLYSARREQHGHRDIVKCCGRAEPDQTSSFAISPLVSAALHLPASGSG